jgi:hypothetical protein
MEYVGLEHFTFLLDILKKKHGVQYNMAGDKFAGMDIEWNYASCHCPISMAGYISLLILKYKHPHPAKPQLSPYKCFPIAYGAKLHITPVPDTLELLDATCKRCIQEIVGSLLYYAQVVNNKLLMTLSAIAACQANATITTEQAVNLLLDYVTTYPNDGIVYRLSDMILCALADAGFLNKTNSHSRAGAHIYLSENEPFPQFNGAILSIAQIIKFVMASAAKSELAALFITARKMIPHRLTLIAMGWPQHKSCIQMDNSTAAGVTNKTIVPRKSKMMGNFGGSVAAHPKINFDITGMQVPRTGPRTTQNTTLTPTTKPIKACMQGTGPRWVLKPIPCLLLPMSPQVSPCWYLSSRNNLEPNSMRGWKISFHIYIICMSASRTLFSPQCKCCCKGVYIPRFLGMDRPTMNLGHVLANIT